MTGDPEAYMLYGQGGEGGSEVEMFKVHLITIKRDDFGEARSVRCSTCGWDVQVETETRAWQVWGAHVRLTRQLLGSMSPN